MMEVFKRIEAKEQLPVIRMEIDYELVTLHDAMVEGDREQVRKTKERLEKLRQELNRLLN
ncbi:hypothetical protein [Terrihalobacillus insolitus]|uniref:hypothetical protein n=1 Tax=Terrihalobacillus insolitus TaxID=2950438 RepID=UPI003A91B18E